MFRIPFVNRGTEKMPKTFPEYQPYDYAEVSFSDGKILYHEPFGEKRTHIVAYVNPDGSLREGENHVSLTVKPEGRLFLKIRCECEACGKYFERVTENRLSNRPDEIRGIARSFEAYAIDAECYHVHRRDVEKRLKELLTTL